jgi:hypothetical protein
VTAIWRPSCPTGIRRTPDHRCCASHRPKSSRMSASDWPRPGVDQRPP